MALAKRERNKRICELKADKGKNYNNAEIGEMFDLTRERIRQVLLLCG